MQLFAPNLIDFYKTSHRVQYPNGTEMVYSNWTPRKSRDPNVKGVVQFGLQYCIKEYLLKNWNESFFFQPLNTVLAKYKRRMDTSLGKDVVSIEHIEALHNLGYLPIRIKALPEGTVCPVGVPMMTIYNTKPEFFWLTNYLETLISCSYWVPCTSATTSFEIRKVLRGFAKQTNPEQIDFVDWQAHDFSMRGMGGVEHACMSGAGHLLSFLGTDTVPAIDFLEEYYEAGNTFVGGSVAATEHSCMSLGTQEDEFKTFERLITEVHPTGILSIVSDTWDLWQVLTDFLPRLKSQIEGRDGKVVVRPDCYDDQTQILTSTGWKFFADLIETDLVAQVLDDGSREFVTPDRIIHQHYSGDMYHIHDHYGKVDLLVTPNHRMVTKYKSHNKIIDAASLPSTHNYKMIRSACAVSNPDIKLSNIDRLRIAFQADGSFCTKSNNIRFTFSKQRKIDRITEICNACNLSYAIYNLKNQEKEIHIKTSGLSFQKDFNWINIGSLTKEWCQEFIEECSYWDSTRRSNNRFKFDTTVERVAKAVEQIAIGAGYGCLMSKYVDNRQPYFSDVYTLHIMKDNKIGGQAWKKDVQYYSGYVHCVKVPSGKILVKRNRCVLVSGNSGDPANIICGDPNGQTEEERRGVIQLLWDKFGGTVSSTGYKVLNPKVGAIYGDGINMDRIKDICERLKANGFASTNMVYGVGSYTFTYTTRDQYGFAMKATYGEVNGEPRNIYKDPVTDKDKLKKSAKGLIQVYKDGEALKFKDECTWEEEGKGELKTVFNNGILVNSQSLAEIRERLNKAL